MQRMPTFGILPPRDLEELLDVGDFGRHGGRRRGDSGEFGRLWG